MKRVIAAMFLISGCAQGVEQSETQQPESAFSGKYTNAAGVIVSIPTDKPLVVAFSAKFCSPCNMEVADWASYVQGADPQAVKLLTLSVSDSMAVTQAWKQSKKAAWEFGVDSEHVFEKYCTEGLIPCILVVKDGQIALKEIGYQTHAALELVSGKWE